MFRIATFNLENLDGDGIDANGQPLRPTLAERAAVLRPALDRLRADILCLQEAHGQETPGAPRDLLALKSVLSATRYAGYTLVSTMTDGPPKQVYDERNLVVAVRPDITVTAVRQINGDIVPNPVYQRVIAGDTAPKKQMWERPLLHVTLTLPGGLVLHVLNAHFKSKLAVPAPNLMPDKYTWASSAAWAEGFFVSSIKRVGAALEARVVIDQIFDSDPDAAVVIAGDFNADSNEVPVMALRGRIEETGNAALGNRVMVPLERNIPEPARFSLIHQGKGEMIDHILASRRLVRAFARAEVHNEVLQDESIAFATDRKFPESDHAPVVAEFDAGLLGLAPVA